MYKVIRKFFDLQDNDHMYSEGDIFPRDNIEVSQERIEELLNNTNKMGVSLIEEIEEKPKRGRKKKTEE